jgi:ketosteroid isomerase-like protein
MAMADSPNVAVVRRLYQARGNPDVLRHVLAREVRWEVVDGFPYGAVYEGLDRVLRDFFGRLFTDFDEFVADGTEFFESGDHVIALGSYAGRARRTGKRFTARFAHVWTVHEGLIVRLQQCADTIQLARALTDEHDPTV